MNRPLLFVLCCILLSISVEAVSISPYRGKFGYIDSQGNVIVEPIYDMASPSFTGDMSPIELNGKFGYINKNGKPVIPFIFDQVAPGILDAELPAFSFDLEPVQFNGKWGYIDQSGRFVIPPEFAEARRFARNGLAVAKRIGTKFGYINTNGYFVMEPAFDFAFNFASNGLARVGIDGVRKYVNAHGDILTPDCEMLGDFAENGLAPAQKNGKWGYVDVTGNFVIQPQFDSASGFGDVLRNDLAEVGIGNEVGLIDRSGKLLIKLESHSYHFVFANGFARIENNKNTKYGFMNIDTGEVIAPIFEAVGSFSANGMAPVKIDNKWGYIDRTGMIVIQPKFLGAGMFSKNGLAPAQQAGGWGFINIQGEFVIPPKYYHVNEFSDNGLARIETGPSRQ